MLVCHDDDDDGGCDWRLHSKSVTFLSHLLEVIIEMGVSMIVFSKGMFDWNSGSWPAFWRWRWWQRMDDAWWGQGNETLATNK